jgi:hypothetical protein
MAAETLRQRGKRYDKNGQGVLLEERSFPGIVARFAKSTGIGLTEEQACQFMVALKEERIQRDPSGLDNYVDFLAYQALALEYRVAREAVRP